MTQDQISLIVERLQARLGLSDSGLGRQLGVSSISIWRWREGHSAPRGVRLKKLKELWEANGGQSGT